jgi:hypothetical protein
MRNASRKLFQDLEAVITNPGFRSNTGSPRLDRKESLPLLHGAGLTVCLFLPQRPRRRPIEPLHSRYVGGLQPFDALVVAVGHDGARAAWVIETDRMADLVHEGVAKIVDIEVAIEANFPP